MVSTKLKPKQKSEKQMPAAKQAGFWYVQKKAFIASFRNIAKKTFFQCAVFDLLTLFSLFIVLTSFLSIVNLISQPIIPGLTQAYILSQNGDTAGAEEVLSTYAPQLSKVIWISLLAAIVACLLSLFFISVFYNKAWALAKNKKVSGRSVGKSFIINFLWMMFWIFILFCTSVLFKSDALAFVVLLEMMLFFYLDPVLRAVFEESKSVWKNITYFAKLGVKFYWFVFFILFSFVFMMLLMLIMSLFMKYQLVLSFLLLVFALLVIGWARNYIIRIVSEIR